MKKRGILLTGGTGFIGGHVIRALRARGDAVWVWTRDVARARRQLPSDVQPVAVLAEIPDAARIDAIVNLAGAPVVGPPWTEARRQLLIDSRVLPTRALLDWCGTRASRPSALISASAIGFYGAAGEASLDETSPPQEVFQSRLCVAREDASNAAQALNMRVVNLRLGLVLGADGGIFSRLALAARLGGAAVIGDGQQWMSWVHVDDVVRVTELAIDDESVHGALNVVAPEPARQREFQRALTRALRRPLLLRIPAGLMRLSLGEMSELLLGSQRVAPRVLQARGFEFAYPTLERALAALITPARS